VVVNDQISPPYAFVGGITVCCGGRLAIRQTDRFDIYSGMSFLLGSPRTTYVNNDPIITFNNDGSKLAFGARVGRGLWWRVMELE